MIIYNSSAIDHQNITITDPTLNITGLSPRTTYSFIATAINTEGVASHPSEQFTITTGSKIFLYKM